MPSRQGHIINGVHCFQSLFTCRIVELLNFSMGFNIILMSDNPYLVN